MIHFNIDLYSYFTYVLYIDFNGTLDHKYLPQKSWISDENVQEFFFYEPWMNLAKDDKLPKVDNLDRK